MSNRASIKLLVIPAHLAAQGLNTETSYEADISGNRAFLPDNGKFSVSRPDWEYADPALNVAPKQEGVPIVSSDTAATETAQTQAFAPAVHPHSLTKQERVTKATAYMTAEQMIQAFTKKELVAAAEGILDPEEDTKKITQVQLAHRIFEGYEETLRQETEGQIRPEGDPSYDEFDNEDGRTHSEEGETPASDPE